MIEALIFTFNRFTDMFFILQDNSPSTSAPSIHPTIKKYLGKRLLTSKESEDRQGPENTWQESSNNNNSTDKSSLSNGSTGSSQAAKSTATTSSNENVCKSVL